MKIGFIGIGVMGESMAIHLLKGGHELYVYNRTKSKTDKIIQAGAYWCENVKEVAERAELIFTIIGIPQDVEEVYLSETGLIDNVAPSTILVDMTTSTPQLAKKIYEAGKARGVQCLDAPVTGGDIGAKNGTLTIFVGGEKAVFEQILPILNLMGKTNVYMGEAGSGQHAKMANQIAIAGAVMGMAESLAYAKSANLDLNEILNAMTTGAATSWQLSNMGPRVIKGDFEPGFYIKHFIKDMRIAAEESNAMGIQVPGLNLVLSLYEELEQKNLENLGTQALFKLYEK